MPELQELLLQSPDMMHSHFYLKKEEEEERQGAGLNALFLLVILLGLLWLFAQQATGKAVAIAERTLEQIGLEKEDLASSQRKAIAKLRQHPTEAKKLKKILDKEGYKDPLAV